MVIMKKLVRSFMVLFLILLFTPNTVSLARSYDIVNYDMDIAIKPNGDAQFEERINYDFSGDFNGVLRDIDLSKTDGYDDIRIYVKEGELLREFSPGQRGDPGEYELSQNGNILSLKVYESTSNREKTFVYAYTLKNVAEKYNDIGTFNRRVIDKNWDVPLKNISIKINIPDGASKDELRVFAHGPLTGRSEILDDKTFSFFVDEVMPGTFVETLAVFPPRLIPDSRNVYDRDELPAILENEQRLADEANRIREHARAELAHLEKQKNIRKRLFPAFLLIILIALLSFVTLNLKYGRELRPHFNGDYYRELPGDYTPSVMSYLLERNNIGPKDIMATLMDLVRKKQLKLIKVELDQRTGLFFRNKTVEKYRLQRIKNTDADTLTTYEVFLMDWFIDRLGGDEGLILDDLKRILKNKKTASEFRQDYKTFKDLVKAEGATKGFFTSRDLTGSGKYILLALFLIISGITALFSVGTLLFGIPAIILGILLPINLGALKIKTRLTRYGVEQRAKWGAFKRFLLHFSNMDKAQIPSIVIWEHYLVYAISLGIAKEVLDQLPKVFSEGELKDPGLTYMGGYGYGFHSFHIMNTTMTNTINSVTQAINTASIAASPSSSGGGFGGGFSGGSSGGGGGGGGGGAF